VLLVLDLRGGPPTTDRSLARGLDMGTVTALRWVRPGAPELQLVREGERWLWVTPVEAFADRSAVDNVLATLRAARWHRREPASAAGPTHAVLTISTASPTSGGKPPEYADLPRRTLAIGAPLPGTEQAWIVDGDQALLVDAWVARALDPDPVTLMIRRPLDAVAQAAWIEITDDAGVLRLEGSPRRLAKPYVALIRPELVAQLHDALAALEIVALPAGGEPPPVAPQRIATPAGTIAIGGACGGSRILLSSPGATGCVNAEAYPPVLEALRRLRGSGRDVIDPRPAPLDAASITLGDGAVLDVTKLRIGEHAADPVRVTELLAVLAAPAQLADVVEQKPSPRTAKVTATLAITDRNGATIALELLPGMVVRRSGEELGMIATPGAVAVLERTGRAYRDLTPWIEDALAVRAIRIDDKPDFVRGAVVGEWTSAEHSAALETLANQLAAPRPIAPGPPTFATVHRVVIVISPPAGQVVERALEVGRKTAAGCPVRAASLSLLLSAAVCDAITQIAR
ncbi:MAG: hypothetical protein H0T42_17880, partial [Deltaproteobacteria bacterium]|nr:hypothetical protein [Deltaproteobacteria bacterium]